MSTDGVHDWAYLVAAAIPALVALIGIVWQGRKTRRRGTDEHFMARSMLEDHGRQLSDIAGDVRDVKEDVRAIGGRVTSLEGDAQEERRTILAAVENHHADLGEGA